MQFIEQLSSKQFKEVEKFFATMPKLSHTIEVTNPNTKKKSSITFWRVWLIFSAKYCKRGFRGILSN